MSLEKISVFFVEATAVQWDGNEWETDAAGNYSAELPPGSYYVMFAEEFGSHTSAFWDGATRWDQSTPIVVKADQTTVVDRVMEKGGNTISGTVTDDLGDPLEGAFVVAIHEHPDFKETSIPSASFGVATTAADGTYTVRGLPDGDFWVLFATITDFQWYQHAAYTGDPVGDGATLIPVAGPVVGIDGSVEINATIAGDLVDSYTLDPVEGICVDAVQAADNTTVIASDVTNSGGDFVLNGVADVNVHVRFSDCTRDVYVTTWDGATNPGNPADADVYLLDRGSIRILFRSIDLRLTDVDSSIFRDDIIWLAGEGITRGCNAERTLFCPTSSVTRGQMAAFLVRALGLTDVDPSIDFTDDNSSIFEADIEKLATAGITRGCGDGTTFCPDQSVTRAQMAAFLVRALGLTDVDPSIDFTDDNGSPFEADIEKLATAGITRGCGDGTTFCPNDPVNRGQMAAFLRRALQ